MPRARQLHDEYFLKAKAEGYAARSAYKLKQIHERYQVLRPGDTVLDLGCAPGSWLQVASEIVGPHGLVVGIDLLDINIDPPANVRAVRGDAFKVSARELLGMMGRPGLFSVVLSDMAPNTAGLGDDLRSVSLCRRVLELATDALAPGGRLVMKVLEGSAYPDLMRETMGVFEFARGYRPDATRDVSREIFVVAMRFRGSSAGRANGGTAGGTAGTSGGALGVNETGWKDVPSARVPPHKRKQVELPLEDSDIGRPRKFKPVAKGHAGGGAAEPPRPRKKRGGGGGAGGGGKAGGGGSRRR